jgi:sugar lactone lactonase YvrE
MKFLPLDLELGEGLATAPDGKSLFWVDILRGLVFTWDLISPPRVVIETPLASSVNFSGASIVVTAGLQISYFNLNSFEKQMTRKIPSKNKSLSANEAKFDKSGNLWIGLMNRIKPDYDGEIWVLDTTGVFCQQEISIGIPNTFEWDQDGSTLYFADSAAGDLYSAQVSSLQIASPRIFSSAGEVPGVPDGSFLDLESRRLINCRWGGGCVVVFNLDGKVVKILELSSQYPTDCLVHSGNLYVVTAADQQDPSKKGGLHIVPMDQLN